ncbi:hypothetical protein [Streptomyces sp. TRM70350]|nr:hypothetical protein [Streptomyces sp. TRM70350]MBV7698203.1 hypothetical protein [Streptomyces sp. TRM70350]
MDGPILRLAPDVWAPFVAFAGRQPRRAKP